MEGEEVYAVPDRFAGALCSSKAQYEDMWQQSLRDPDAFWGQIASEFFWEYAWQSTVSYNFHPGQGPVYIRWFVGGRTNVCYNAVDRHVEAGHGQRTAFLWEGNEPGRQSQSSYCELQEQVCRAANVLLGLGVSKGDRVALYLPMVMDQVVAMLACARIGAVHTVVFGGFSSKALADRLLDSRAKVLVTCDAVQRGPKLIELGRIAASALQLCQQEGYAVPHVLLVRCSPAQPMPDGLPGPILWWHELLAAADTHCPPVWCDSEDPLFMLYTSGSTGRPKGVVHTVGGYMVYAATTFRYVFDYRPGDVYWCTADLGWITGHSYIVYGPLLAGATSVLFEGVPTYPDAGRFWAVCAKYDVTQFYTAPTAIRALMRHGDHWVARHNLGKLRVLGSVGEPINRDAWLWYYTVVGQGHCAVVDTYWQTETGGHVMTPLPGAIPMKPGACATPFFGVDWALLDKDGKEVTGVGEGYIVFRRPWPGMLRGLYGDQERFEKAYFSEFPGFYSTGDGGHRDKDGYLWVTGRMDDVMSVSGHRIGTAEVESALASHPAVAEAAAVEVPHTIKGGSIQAYVVLHADSPALSPGLEQELRGLVRAMVGSFAAPDIIRAVPGLPKTRSGKTMRRILRKIAMGQAGSLGDTSTIADPDIVATLVALASTWS